MKHIGRSLLLLLLVAGMLVSCGGTATPPTTSPTTPSNDVTDDSPSLRDPSVGDVIGSVSSADAEFLKQVAIIMNAANELSDPSSAFPDADLIIGRDRHEATVYGMYAWAKEFLEYYDDIDDMDLGCFRLSDPDSFNDEIMTAICNTGVSVMTTMGLPVCVVKDIPEKDSDDNTYQGNGYFTGSNQTQLVEISNQYYKIADWIGANVKQTLDLLEKYGPEGEFFEKNPGINYNPIRYVEIFNEPNFQYMLAIKTSTGADAANHAAKTKMYVMLQVCMYRAIKNIYGDSVKIVGFGAGGAAGLDRAFIEAAMNLQYDPTLENVLNTSIQNEATEIGKTRLAEYLELADGEIIKLDVVGSMDVLSTHPYWDYSPFAQNSTADSIGKYLKQIRNYLESALKIKGTYEATLNEGYNPNTITDPDDPNFDQAAFDSYNAIRQRIERAAYEDATTFSIWYTECGWQLKSRRRVMEGNLTDDFIKNYDLVEYGEVSIDPITGAYVHDENMWGTFDYNSINTGVDQLTQAAMIVQEYIYGLRSGVDRITYMNLQDTDNCNYGIFNRSAGTSGDGAWRKACYAIQVMTSLMPNPHLVRIISEQAASSTTAPCYIYEIESDVGGENVIVAFTAQKAQTIRVPWSEDYALVTDMFGITKIIAAQNGNIILDGGACMMYVRHVDTATLIANGYLSTIMAKGTESLSYAWQEKRTVL